MTPGITDLAPVVAATWPPATQTELGPFTIFQNTGGGSRVRAARLADPHADGCDVTDDDIHAAVIAMETLNQPPLFAVLGPQTSLDHQLAAMGFAVKDPTDAMVMPTADLAATPPPVTCFETWPPLAIQEEIWLTDDIGPDRLTVMMRADGPKTSLFGRVNDRPAGSAFVAVHDGIAMLHGLVVTPEARRKGLARNMMHAAGDWAANNGADTFSLLVTQRNTAARSLYTSLGFQPVGHYHYRERTA